MQPAELREYEEVRRWLSEVRQHGIGSEDTPKVYLRYLGDFCEWTRKNPSRLIDERKLQLKSDDEEVKRTTERLVTEFSNYLETEAPNPQTGKKGLTRGTVRTVNGALRSFFQSNYVPLQMRVPKLIQPENPRKPVTLEELKNLTKMAGNLRNQALIAFLAYTGMSREDACQVTYGHIQRELEARTVPIRLEVRRRKAGIKYETFLGEEVLDYLLPYLELRKKGTKDIPPETLKPSSPLLRKMKAEVQPIDRHDLYFMVHELSRRTGITASPHRLRKFFETNMAVNGVPPIVAKYWMGHTISSDVESHYILPSVEQQRNLYSEAVSKFSIRSQSELDLRLEVLELERQYETLMERKPEEIHRNYHRLPLTEKKEFLKRAVIAADKSVKNPAARDPEPKRKRATEHDCQRIISEGELEEYLTNGWRVVLETRSGKFVVED